MDCGLQDEFVAVMPGVIYGRLPTARIVDVCHAKIGDPVIVELV